MDVNHESGGRMDERIDEALLDRWLAGQCTPDERARIERWSGARPENAELIAALREATGPGAEGSWNVEAAWQRVSVRLGATAGRGAPDARAARSLPFSRRPRVPRPLLRAAALLVVALGAIAVWRSVAGPRGGSAGGRALDEYAAPVGSTRVVVLGDGSEVTLAPASRLVVPRDAAGARDVTLDGEAFFRVAHDPARPFRVLSGGNQVRVLGTEFDVRTARGSGGLRVVVASGRVSVGRLDRDPATVLEAGQMAELAPDGSARVTPADLDRLLAWRRGRIEIDELPLVVALEELERWYDVELEVTDAALGARPVSASLRGEPIEQVLESLALAMGARIERSGRVYRVAPDAPPR
jgi:transmembrane sensor